MKQKPIQYFLNSLSIWASALMLLFFVSSPFIKSFIEQENKDLIENCIDDNEEETKDEYKIKEANLKVRILFVIESKIITRLKTAYLNRIIQNFPIEVELMPPQIV